MKEIVRAIAVSVILVMSLTGWTTREAHERANQVLVQVGSYCSGIVFDKKRGLVVTANHCTKKFTQYKVTTKETSTGFAKVVVKIKVPQTLTINIINPYGDISDRLKFESVLLGGSESYDVAILQITTNLDLLRYQAVMSKHRVKFGDPVFTMGNPAGTHGTVARGEIINPRASFKDDDMFRTNRIMYDAVINQGSSGGGLFNAFGNLVGITNWTGDNSDNSASPVSEVRALMKDLKL